MKFIVPAIMISVLLMVSPAFAQHWDPATTSPPSADTTKDEGWSVATRTKKHVASHKNKKHMPPSAGATKDEGWSVATRTKKHVASHKNKKAQTTGSGSSSAPGAGVNKDETAPKR